MYTARQFCQTKEDLRESLRKVNEIGYRAVQLSGYNLEIPPEFIKDCLDEYDLKVACTHFAYPAFLNDFDKLVYVSSTKREQPFVAELVKDIPAPLLTQYHPSGDGVRGAPALWNDHPAANELWMSLMLFVQKVKEEKYK